MHLPIYVIDAFADRPLTGNPAAVCPLETWLPDATMQAIAAEMNHSETVFLVPQGDDFAIRWFTPIREVDLVGHATLAAGHLVLDRLRPGGRSVRFLSQSGALTVSRESAGYAMDMPALPPSEVAPPPGLFAALGQSPRAVLAAKHYLVVFEHAEEVRTLAPDMAALAALDRPAVIVAAPGGEEGVDFVSRFFAPANGVPEDPVSGSPIAVSRLTGRVGWARERSWAASSRSVAGSCGARTAATASRSAVRPRCSLKARSVSDQGVTGEFARGIEEVCHGPIES